MVIDGLNESKGSDQGDCAVDDGDHDCCVETAEAGPRGWEPAGD